MIRKTNWALSAALLMGVSAGLAVTLVSPSPVHAAAALTVENKALVDAINGAQADNKAGRFADALAKAKQADAIQGKPAELTRQVHQMIIAYALAAKDYTSALAQIDKNIAAGEGDKNKNLADAFGIALQSGNQAKAISYADQLGNNLGPTERMFIAQAYANAGKTKEALDEVQPLLQAAQPPEGALLLVQSITFKTGDSVGRRNALEQLVSFYPKPQYWHDLLQLARNEKGLSDEQSMDIYRLRMAVGDLKTADEYSEMAQVALVAGYPNEAKTVLDKAAAAKLLAGERSTRLVNMTNDRVKQDNAIQADMAKKAAADVNVGVKLGLVYWTYGKNKEAEDAIRAGMKGKLADPEAAKVALGHVLFSAGKKQDAVNAFASVARNSKQASVARLWAIYARRA